MLCSGNGLKLQCAVDAVEKKKCNWFNGNMQSISVAMRMRDLWPTWHENVHEPSSYWEHNSVSSEMELSTCLRNTLKCRWRLHCLARIFDFDYWNRKFLRGRTKVHLWLRLIQLNVTPPHIWVSKLPSAIFRPLPLGGTKWFEFNSNKIVALNKYFSKQFIVSCNSTFIFLLLQSISFYFFHSLPLTSPLQ